MIVVYDFVSQIFQHLNVLSLLTILSKSQFHALLESENLIDPIYVTLAEFLLISGFQNIHYDIKKLKTVAKHYGTRSKTRFQC